MRFVNESCIIHHVLLLANEQSINNFQLFFLYIFMLKRTTKASHLIISVRTFVWASLFTLHINSFLGNARPNTIKRNLCYKQNCFLLTLGRKQNIRAGRTLSSVFLKIVLMVNALRRRKSNFFGAISLVLLIISSEQR